MRTGEMTGLRWEDVDLLQDVIHVVKKQEHGWHSKCPALRIC
jgi:integrase